ncbi:ROK family transcriptional regulator [Bradyrhizobium diazoefficiens]|uniref:Transcriptional regulator n=1 Tax=Bradyrhizobium diazoefficiens TaxID=1355477 RepID=A0A809YHP8_9BRAD|nr:ROK family transcriptional regulator [Bradyrhizobium diazoefficiens]WLA61217.1 ROK family transcriptional regulator [Bradyrhizobium diazoefficiens]BCA04679.1 transcriptional regulator [Bradyrhizobium diazoefficiens]BCA22034.1 transcriptional regulator [Bradyrhizobium diazoefficiens]BCE31353.1 transcriptional regulator [Bradyrhizobium diazoefficiens]BCE40196.1 transcriptional regulator [Bradyrhizobium diazoefficiens]
MEMPEQPRSRRQTRAAILTHLLQSGGSFRPPLAKAVRLSEASLSRILFDLKAEGLIEEVRRPAPYVGGPTGLVSLDGSVALAAVELTGQWLSVGVGTLSGELHYTERVALPAKPTAESVGRVFREALTLLRDWTRRRRIALAQIGVSIPGLGRLSISTNPIIPCDIARIGAMLAQMFAGVPVEFTNSVVAHATFHRCRRENYPFSGAHLFIFVGQGVAGTWVDDPTEADALQPVELGHMVFGTDGPRCRCGHHGCVEAYTSLPALAELLGVSEAELLQLGSDWVTAVPLSARARQELRRRLFRLGLAIGNTLNVKPCRGVAISGWPSLLAEDDRKALVDGVDASLLGGPEHAQVSLAFVPPSNGNDPRAALAFAAFCLACRGGMPAASTEAA